MAKLTLEDCKKTAHERGGLCLSEEYINEKEKMKWTCSYNHEWSATYNNVKKGSWCPECAGNIKFSMDDCIRLASVNGGKCLTTEYANVDAIIKWKCVCGHVINKSFYKMKKYGWKCKECEMENKLQQFLENGKECRKCHRIFSLNSQHWIKTDNIFYNKCRECKNKEKSKHRRDNIEVYRKREMEWKKRNSDKVKVSKKLEYEKNKNKYCARAKQYRLRNIKRDSELKHKRYTEKKEEIIQYNKEYYRKNKKRIAHNVSEWVKNNPEKYLAIQIRRKEREKNLDATINYEDIVEIFDAFNNMCFKCGSKKHLCLDHHRPLSKGNGLSRNNAVILCKSCNSSKHDKMPEEFYTEEELLKLDIIFAKIGGLK